MPLGGATVVVEEYVGRTRVAGTQTSHFLPAKLE
jgi:hypothetical protein